ncbi:serine/threonine protein kinase [Corallococcus carmarthensis]|uniref:Serine/threonine protein kinase n=1 Tax=Corallococcus carmarthensis TaxID=2316728 RepID=A0A3A8KJF6_9BACT|nr:serine/threonine-protein kinase [Corallococcus carmarthensis]NOK19791.1 serine/threonine protein kinase [Corallococcus carmarthensis]RKH07259.1 serine/threonine protein kinase [Corallococcus carmarthensis]
MQIGNYRVIRTLASGEVTETFLVSADGPGGSGAPRVLKRVLAAVAGQEDLVATFRAEAQRAARLDHPNVVRVVDAGEADGRPFLVTEYVDGPTVRRLLQWAAAQRLPLPPGLCAKLVSLAAEGLAYAHAVLDVEGQGPFQEGVDPRDVRPENVWVSREGVVKVGDFGMTRSEAQDLRTRASRLEHKLPYLSLAYVQGQPQVVGDAVYALGMMLYELLTGRYPFDATDTVALFKAILSESFVPAVERRLDLPEALQRILERALTKDREQRYADCRAFQADLERFILSLDEPVGPDALARWAAAVT